MNYRFRCIITIFAEAFFVIEILSVDPIQHWQHFEWTFYCACVMCMCVLHIGFLTQYSGKLAMNGKNTEIAFFVNCKSKAQKRFFPLALIVYCLQNHLNGNDFRWNSTLILFHWVFNMLIGSVYIQIKINTLLIFSISNCLFSLSTQIFCHQFDLN